MYFLNILFQFVTRACNVSQITETQVNDGENKHNNQLSITYELDMKHLDCITNKNKLKKKKVVELNDKLHITGIFIKCLLGGAA